MPHASVFRTRILSNGLSQRLAPRGRLVRPGILEHLTVGAAAAP